MQQVRREDRRLLGAKAAHGRRSGPELAVTDALTVAGLLAVLVAAAILVTRGVMEPALFPVGVILAATTFATAPTPAWSPPNSPAPTPRDSADNLDRGGRPAHARRTSAMLAL